MKKRNTSILGHFGPIWAKNVSPKFGSFFCLKYEKYIAYGFCFNFIIRNVVITMCKIMIYFDFRHIRIYIDLNERVFIIVTDVIDTVLGPIVRYTSKHG